MANAEYKFTNKNADVRGRVAEVVEFAKSRGILLKQIEVFKDPDALKDKDITHEVFDTFPVPDCEDDDCCGCGDECCCNRVPDDTPPSEEEVFESLHELFAKIFGFDE